MAFYQVQQLPGPTATPQRGVEQRPQRAGGHGAQQVALYQALQAARQTLSAHVLAGCDDDTQAQLLALLARVRTNLDALPPLAVASWIFQKKGLAAYRKVRESLSRVTANLAENICGVRVVQAFVREARNLSVFARLNRKHVKNVVRASFVWNSYTPFINITFVAATSIILIYGSSLIARGQLQIGELSAFILLLGMFFWPIEDLTQLYHATLSATAASERIFQLLQTEPEVKDRPGASPIGPIEGTVEFENVYFKYDEGDSKWVLKGVSFKALPGQTIALVGPTGGGKTSIVSLIPRFYEPQRGCVRIDGIDIKDVTLRSLHNQMGIVLQESFLFSGTVMENLKFARPDVSDEEVIEAARALGAHEVIMRLSEGYKTLVRERGTGLSQGQRQLICLTRAFIANPKILILDEATSSVDTIIEQTLQRALKRLTQRRTSFVVAHRLSTIRDADLVLVIEDGTVQEAGSHHQLMGRNGRYARMYGEYVRRLR